MPKRHAISLRLLVILGGTLAACLSGCTRSDSQTSATDLGNTRAADETDAVSPETAIAPIAVQSSPFGGKLAEEVALFDPRVDGWRSEALYEVAQRQLNELAHHLEKGADGITSAAISSWFHVDFSAPLLGPEPSELVTSYQDSLFVVQSAPDEWQPVAQTDPVLSLVSFLQPLAGAGKVRIKFKTYRVSLAPDGTAATTRALVSTLGHFSDPARTVEQHAIWNISWHLTATSDAPPQISSIVPESYQVSRTNAETDRLFTDCTVAAFKDSALYHKALLPGLDDWAARLHNQIGMESEGYQGMAMGDANGDDLDDLYLCQPGGLPNLLFLRNADGTLREAPADNGTDWLERTRSALFVDLDNDSDQDLLVVCNTQVLLLENDGSGKFTKRGMLQLPGSPFSCTAADYDTDGDLDLFICDYGDLWGGFGDLNERFPIPYHDANNGGPNALFRNDGAWQFSNVTQESGLGQNNRRWSLSAAWEDFDNDGDLDLYVANDFGRNNLFRNDGGKFTDIADAAGVEDISPGMSVTWGDANRDGWPDLYVSNMFSGAGNRITFQDQFMPGTDTATKGHYQRFARGNALFLNNGDGTFLDSSEASGVSVGRWAWASRFGDFNNDGLEDIVVANGFFTQEDSDDL
ncbi:MAG: VCBS repeat-containing protein [Verrucomicrobiales bacterium]